MEVMVVMVKKSSKQEQAVAYLTAYIEENQLKAGDRLPTEWELAQTLEVSRTTVQGALRKLVESGAAYNRKGYGTYVAGAGQKEGLSLPLVIADQRETTGGFEYIRGAQAYLGERNGQLLMHCTNGRLEDEQRLVTELVEKGAKRLLVLPISSTTSGAFYQRMMDEQGVRFVFIDKRPQGVHSDYVCCDNVRGGYLATEHLIRKGHTRIGFVAASLFSASSRLQRFLGYSMALEAYGLSMEPSLIRTEDEGSENGEAVLRMMGLPQPPTAIFAVSDGLAMTCITTLIVAGYKVPEEVSVVGFDGLPFFSTGSLRLTSVRQPFYAVGYQAARLACEPYTRAGEASTCLMLPVELLEQDTVKEISPANS